MSIAEEIRELDPQGKDLRQFSWLVGGILLAIGAFFWYHGKSWSPILLWIGGPLVVLGTAVPLAVKPFYYLWMSLAAVMGFVMTRVILTIFFFLVLTPVGIFFRIIGRDALHRKLDRQASTYWIEKEYPISDRSRYEKFF